MVQDLFKRSRKKLGGHSVVLFGSRASGEARPRSDFDLAMIGDAPLPLRDFYALSDELDSLPMLYRFDWVDLARISQGFREAARRQCKVIHEA